MAPVNIRLNPLAALVCVAIGLCFFFYMFGLPTVWFREEERVSMKELLSVSIELAKRGGDRVREIREANSLSQTEKGKTKEGAAEFVSQGDIESHRAIVYGFAKAFPGLKVISEEHETKPVDLHSIPDVNKHLDDVEKIIVSDQSIPINQITVWIDPLDATQEYTENLREYVTVMVCVAVNGYPTIGVIHKPMEPKQTETAWAWVGYGHSSNLKKAEKTAKPQTAYKIIVSRSHAGSVEAVAKKAFGEETVVIPAGGAGYKTLEVVRGNADAYTHVTLIKKWDICAGNAILSALDGKMTTLEGSFIDYSVNSPEKNDKGLLGTLYNHYDILDKLAPVVEAIAEEKKKKTPKSPS